MQETERQKERYKPKEKKYKNEHSTFVIVLWIYLVDVGKTNSLSSCKR